MRNKDTQTYRHKDTSWAQEDCTFLVGYMGTYLSQSVYFTGQYKEMTQVKIKLQQFLDLTERNRNPPHPPVGETGTKCPRADKISRAAGLGSGI
jgi:hypothetical protein